MLIGFKDSKDGFYQVEVKDESSIPAWTNGMTRLTEAQRAAAFPPPPAPEPAPAPADPVAKLQAFLASNPDVAALLTK